MTKRIVQVVVSSSILLLLCAPPMSAQEAKKAAPKDLFPHACVDCHLVTPEGDLRFGPMIKRWATKVEGKSLAAAKAAAPKGMTIKGKHPAMASLKDVPAACLKCHGATSKIAPPLAPIVHLVHLGADSQFVKKFAGDCKHCHKLDPARGVLAVPSAPEK